MNNNTNIKNHTSMKSIVNFICACMFAFGPMVMVIGLEMWSFLGFLVCLLGFAMLYASMKLIDVPDEDV